MRLLTSYTLSVVLGVIFSLAVVVMIVVEHFSVIIDDNIGKISGMESSTDFAKLDGTIKSINTEAELNNIKIFTKAEAYDVVIKYADYLLTTYNARAETDRPREEGDVLRLQVKFATYFGSAEDFLRTMGNMLRSQSPIIQLNSLLFTQEKDGEKSLKYKIDIDAEILQPYMTGDSK